MAIIKPFAAVRPNEKVAMYVASLPYDVMNSDEARAMCKGNKHSFLHVSRAEVDLPKSVDEHSTEVYEKARDNFYGMLEDRTLMQDTYPFLYIYEQIMEGRRQTGLVCCSSVEDYFSNVIKKHELTRLEKEEDRINHMETLRAHVGPVFLTYPKNNSLNAIIDEVVKKQEPVYNFLSNDGVRHAVWIIRDDDKIKNIVSIFEKEIPFTYIADGHHRTASAAKVGKKMREANPEHSGKEEYNFFLSVLFPDNELQIMDYNRVVKDLNGNSEEEFLSRVISNFEFRVSCFESAKPTQPRHFSMYLGGKWYTLVAKPEIIKTDPIGALDVSILQENILEPILGIKDVRTDKRIDFVGGIRGLQELQRRVDSGEMAVAFALYPVSLKQLMDIADSGNIMPPKSTWFEPKLRDGLFSHLLE